MSGIHESKIICISDDIDIDDMQLFCGLCSMMFDEPMVTACCQQTYCHECIKQSLGKQCPSCETQLERNMIFKASKIVTNLLNELVIKCEFVDNGCDQEIVYKRYKQHIEECCYNTEAICGDCGEENGDLAEHNCEENQMSNKELRESFRAKIQTLTESKAKYKRKYKELTEECKKSKANASKRSKTDTIITRDSDSD